MNKKSTVFCDIDGTIVMHRKFEDLDSRTNSACNEDQ